MVRIQCFNHMKLAVDLPKIAATMTKNSCRELAATLPNISCRIAHDPSLCLNWRKYVGFVIVVFHTFARSSLLRGRIHYTYEPTREKLLFFNCLLSLIS